MLYYCYDIKIIKRKKNNIKKKRKRRKKSEIPSEKLEENILTKVVIDSNF